MPRGFKLGWLSVLSTGERRTASTPAFIAFVIAVFEWTAAVTILKFLGRLNPSIMFSGK